MLNFAANPIAIPVEEDGVINAFVGEEVVIKFYAAALPPPGPADFDWFYNNSDVKWGILSANKKSLTIPNVQVSHAGEYEFRVLIYFGSFMFHSTAATTLNVTGKELKVFLGIQFCMSVYRAVVQAVIKLAQLGCISEP